MTLTTKTDDGLKKERARLNRFITGLKYKYPNLIYKWVVEYNQKENLRHYHVLTNLTDMQLVGKRVEWYQRKKFNLKGVRFIEKELSEKWGSFVDIKLLYNENGSINYLMKYVIKAEQYVQKGTRIFGGSHIDTKFKSEGYHYMYRQDMEQFVTEQIVKQNNEYLRIPESIRPDINPFQKPILFRGLSDYKMNKFNPNLFNLEEKIYEDAPDMDTKHFHNTADKKEKYGSFIGRADKTNSYKSPYEYAKKQCPNLLLRKITKYIGKKKKHGQSIPSNLKIWLGNNPKTNTVQKYVIIGGVNIYLQSEKDIEFLEYSLSDTIL